ncbi:ABC transporter family protein [Neorickettsia helminthoeca str. Oregon]|uniref:ABC transporter family protein n=1 Tax=Neorickettsia helminthoeca str. Oregon TaxID=1286528 RepID=X5HLP6_9RICK|nr:ABC transporter ATP-binding protein [Neorickettsia helminthoeca]AHX11340.1 ABC transporter family protein [Neorickettsia helminthoeca str. Oregon]
MYDGILLSHVRKSIFLVFLAVLTVFLSGFLSIALGKIIGHSVQSISDGGIGGSLLLMIVFFSLFLSLIVSFRGIFSGLLGVRIAEGLLFDLYGVLIKANLETINRNARLIPTILGSDVMVLQNFFGSGGPVLLRNIMTFLGSLIILFYTEKTLFLYLILSIPVILLLLLLFGVNVKRLSFIATGKSDKVYLEIKESLSNIQIIKAFLKERFFFNRVFKLTKEFSRSFVRYVIIRSVFIGIVMALVFLGVSIFIDFGVGSVLDNRINSATLSEFIFYALLASTSIGRIMDLYPDLQQVSNAHARIENLYKDLFGNQEDETTGQHVEQFDELEFKDVQFSYKSSEDNVVINNLSFKINRGEHVAFVGASGGGKSTILALILGFYSACAGCITINGIPVSNLSRACVRSLFAWVPQELSVISGNLKENVCMKSEGNSDNDDHFADICAAANIHDLPKNTDISDLSRGQKQRINIARAIFADRQVILLDEATSSLDRSNEKDIDSIIAAMPRDKTVIMVAHRFSGIKNMDKIIVIKKGKVEAMGTHEELLSASAFYRQMAEE